jgi:hypothetical protein
VAPNLADTGALEGARSTLGVLLMQIPYAVRNSLFFFFLLFLLRGALRNQLLAATAWVLLFVGLNMLGNPDHLVMAGVIELLIFSVQAVLVLRWGVLTLVTGHFAGQALLKVPPTFHTSWWFFGNSMFMLAVIIGLTTWALYTSMAGRRLWRADLFE